MPQPGEGCRDSSPGARFTLQSDRLQPCKRPRRARIERVFVAGIPLRDETVLELARLVNDPGLAHKLEDAYRREVKVLALTIPERERILVALENAPVDLAELRGVLLPELEWLRQEGRT